VAGTFTCNCSKVTDEGFGYSLRGELNTYYQSSPNSGGYYYIPITYWANGLIETFGPFLIEDELGYVPDGEGRAGSVYDYKISGSLVPSISYYNPPGQPTGTPTGNQPTQLQTSCVNGTCYPISYAYDPNTLRMTQYSVALNGGTISGTLTWNQNGSLNQLVVADPFNSADVQTCNYTADDLSRIASATCMNGSTNVWGQTFSYDSFGNITKTVPTGDAGVLWNPGYNYKTNHYTMGGTGYDADGNVLNDGSNTYTWDAEGKPLTTLYSSSHETYAFTYDALGHKVELSVNGTYGGSYVTIGKFQLSALGQTPLYSEYPFPGGSLASEGGGGTGVQLADWLGTSRAFWSYSGGSYIQSGAHAPFGEAYGYNTGNNPKDFTGQENDGSLSNTTYYFPERQYRSSQGRWLSPDPAGKAAVNPSNPQSWNRYAYVLNNPLKLTDPTGLECVWDDGSFDSEDDEDTGDPGDCQAQGGTWIELGQLDNWSVSANSELAYDVSMVQNGYWNAIAATGLDGSTYVTSYNSNGTVNFTDYGGTIQFYNYNPNSPNPVLGTIGQTVSDPGGSIANWIANQLATQPQDPDAIYLGNLSNQISFFAYNTLGTSLNQRTCVGAGIALAAGGATLAPGLVNEAAEVPTFIVGAGGGLGLTVANACQ
jgi:RHS repeat-associated protein